MGPAISSKKILLVEGKDEVSIIESIIRGIKGDEENIDIHIKDVGGCRKFPSSIEALFDITGFKDNIEMIGIVRDADKDYYGTFQQVKSVLKRFGFPCPQYTNSFTDETPRVGVFILPDNENNGMLEDLLLKSICEHSNMECVDNYIECIKKIKICFPKNIAKAKCQIFLAGMPEITHNVGLGAQKKYWNFEHECMKEFIKFIQEFCFG